MNIAEIRDQLSAFETFFAGLGYDTVSMDGIVVTAGGLALNVYIMDEFQKNIPYDWRVRTGIQAFFAEDVPGLWDEVSKLPGRERRELEVMLRKAQEMRADESQLRSDAARAFAKEIAKLGDEYRLLEKH